MPHTTLNYPRGCIALLAGCAVLAWVSTIHASKPNIVLIVADDLGWNDVSYHGGEVRTPNIDRLVRTGVELDRFYTCAICSPTRAGVMTGRYPIRFGLMRSVIPPWRDYGLPADEVTLPEALAQASYTHRGIFGKWHLGHMRRAFHPLGQGFTTFIGHFNGHIDYFTQHRDGERDWHHDLGPGGGEGYSTDLITDAAVRFIGAHADGDAPFFCYVPYNAPHTPFQALEEDLALYAHLGDREPQLERAPEPSGEGQRGRGQSVRQTMAAMIHRMDVGIGRILDALEHRGIADDTVVWFFSDNGGLVPASDNAPLRGGKFGVFEGGIRVPAAVRWPGGGLDGGRKVDTLLTYLDVMPTLLRIAGLEGHADKPFDGINALDILRGRGQPPPREFYTYFGMQSEAKEQIAIHTPKWKLIILGPNVAAGPQFDALRKVHLFRIDTDPGETTDLSESHPEVREALVAKLVAFRKLQPEGGIPVYSQRGEEFRPPADWQFDYAVP